MLSLDALVCHLSFKLSATEHAHVLPMFCAATHAAHALPVFYAATHALPVFYAAASVAPLTAIPENALR